MSLEDKIDIVKSILKDKDVAIAFSGGADSTLLAYLSSEVSKSTFAITIDNHLMPTDFIEYTKRVCDSFEIEHHIIDLNFYKDEDFLLNDSKRCFTCRNMMYNEIRKVAYENNFNFICDGNNISDLISDRPGILIIYENEFETPLIKARLTTKEIHEYLDKNNIPYSKSTTCLATRIPTDTPITKEKIERISYCEDYILKNTECEIVKVRDFEKFSICEVDKINEIIKDDKFKQINNELKSKGYEKVTLNLSQIEDDEEILIDHNEGSFSYKLPFTINLENTKRQLQDEIIFENIEKIELEKITIFENGLICGRNLENKKKALDSFMNILPKLRRNI